MVSVYQGAYDPTTNYDDASQITALETQVVRYDGTAKPPFPKLPIAQATAENGEDAKHSPHPQQGTWIARGFIQVTQTGLYTIAPGKNQASFNITEVEGREVYRRVPPPPMAPLPNGKKNKKQRQPHPSIPTPVHNPFHMECGQKYAFKTVFLTQAANAAFWITRLDKPGTLNTLVKKERKFPWLLDKKEADDDVNRDDDNYNNSNNDASESKYRVFDNIWFQDARMCGGWNWDKKNPDQMTLNVNKLKQACKPLTVRHGVWVGIPFGATMGDYHQRQRQNQLHTMEKAEAANETVLLIRSAIGNRALAWDFRPPSREKLPNIPDHKKKWESLEYSMMVEGVQKTLDNIGEIVSNYQPGQGYQVMGFVWFQGHRDTTNKAWAQAYETNLVSLIQDLRRSLQQPQLPVVIGTIGFLGFQMPRGGTKEMVWQAQMNVGDSRGAHAQELGPWVATVDTREFWRDASLSPAKETYHYHRNVETYLLIGQALANSMINLLDRRQEQEQEQQDNVENDNTPCDGGEGC